MCLAYISQIKSDICYNFLEKIIITSLNNSDLCETAIRNLPFLFYKKPNKNISIVFETIKHFDEIKNILFVKYFRILMCTMYGKTIYQNNKIIGQEELFCIECEQNMIKTDLQQSYVIDDTYKRNLNEFWKILLLSLVNNPNTVIRCEVIKNIPMITNHFYPDSYFKNQMLMLINDKDEEVRIQCSKILNSIIFEKNLTGNIQMVESAYFTKILNTLCSAVNNSLKSGNKELQYTSLETIFNIGW
jgi:hypothetical protein